MIRKAKVAFQEWRYFSGLAPEDVAMSAKLYLKEENKDFDENDTCVTESKITAKAEFVYEKLSEFGKVKELRIREKERES